jgi:hypothetical protein
VIRGFCDLLDPFQFLFALRVWIPALTAQVIVKPTAAHAQYSAQQCHRIGLLLLGDELIPQLDSLTKKAVAS